MNQRRTYLISYEFMDGQKKRTASMRLAASDEEEAKELARKHSAYGEEITITKVEDITK